MKKEINLNIGCGPTGQIDGFVNIDNSKAVLLSKFPKIKWVLYKLKLISEKKFLDNWEGVTYMDASKKMLYSNSSISNIYTSHFLEHVPKSRGEKVLYEAHRVLKVNGSFRIVVPDLVWYARNYVDKTQYMLDQGASNYTRKEHDDFLETIYGAYLDKKRYGLLHSYMYDVPTLFVLLEKVGFREIKVCKYREGESEILYKQDSRPEDSIHIECVK